MTSKTMESSSQVLPQGDNATNSGPLAGPPEHQGSRARNQVFKSGPLFISSKGIGWTSWKKRWFILTRTSLVFFRSDPSATPQKGGEMNLTLGGIDLNNSASVEVKVDKKLLTVFFPDGRDGRAFTLKAETLEDLNEWKTALENALKVAPPATQVAGQNGLLKNEQAEAANGSPDQQNEKPPTKSMVIGRPILLALEDIDGSPSFLEKALKFIEDHGVKIEGILRQAADVDDVHHRVREYEQGKTEFSANEDAHVIADCIKYILRELPSSPVPATCCNALLGAFRSDRNNRLNAMRSAILETFPEPNRRLLQRILQMMQTVVSNKTVNRMSTSAVAACMSPLLLRPLLAGDCELENTHMDVAGDGSLQLLQAAAAANHAQAIIITLLDEYDNIFGEGSASAELFSDESGTVTEEASDDDTYDDEDDDDEYIDDDDDEGHEYASDDLDEETDDDYENSVIETCSESGDHAESDSCDEKPSRSSSLSKSPDRANNNIPKKSSPLSSPSSPVPRNLKKQEIDDNLTTNNDRSMAEVDNFRKSRTLANVDTSYANESANSSPRLDATKFLETASQVRRTPRWGRTSARKNLSMESIDFALEDEDDEIERLEAAKIDLQNRIAEEANGNAILQASMEKRKKALHERRLALEKDVTRLQEQLQKEKDLRSALEARSNISQIPSSAGISEKTKNDLKEIALEEEKFNKLKQRFDDLGAQIRHHHEQNAALLHDRDVEIHDASRQRTMLMNNKDYEMKGAPSHIERSIKDDGQRSFSSEGNDRDSEWNNELSLSTKNQNQPNNTSRGGLPKFGWLPNNSTSSEASKSISSVSKKSSSKGEGATATTSALSKLSNRLNFLKERRNQIASELQNLDKTKSSSSSNQPALSPGKGKAPELPIVNSGDKNHGSGGSFVQNQDEHTHQSSYSSSDELSKEGDFNKGNRKKSGSKRISNLRTESERTEADNKENSKKNDYERSSNSRLDTTSSYSSGKGISCEGDRTEVDNKENNKKSDDKRSSNSRADAPSTYSSGKGMPNEGDRREGGNKDSNKKSDNNNSISKLDSPSYYSSGPGLPNEGNRTDGGNKDNSKKNDNKKSSNSNSDAPSSYGSSKGMSNEVDNQDNKEGDILQLGSKSDAPISHSNESTKKSKSKERRKKGSSSKTDSSSSQNLDQGQKSDSLSSQHLDRVRSEQPSRSSDKGRQPDGQQSSTSRTLSR